MRPSELPRKGLKKGDYSLAMIAVIGHDPNTGKSYEECQTEFDSDLKALLKEQETLRWYELIRRLKLRIRLADMIVRQGM